MNTIFIIFGMNHQAIEPRSTNCRVDAPATTPPRRHEEVIKLHLLADDQRVRWPEDVATVGTTIRPSDDSKLYASLLRCTEKDSLPQFIPGS